MMEASSEGAAAPLIGEPHWRNPPPFSERGGDTLTVRTGEKTDFWNRTFYGFKHGVVIANIRSPACYLAASAIVLQRGDSRLHLLRAAR